MLLRVPTLTLLVAAAFAGLPASAATPSNLAGEYNATFSGGSFDTSGTLRLVVGRGGHGSVAVRLGDEPPCVALIGGPGLGGWTGVSIPINFIIPDPDMQLRLVVTPNPEDPSADPVITGEIEDDGNVFQVEATKAAPTSGSAAGRHTFVLGSGNVPGQDGSGYARITPNGHVIGVALAGSRKPASFGGRLSANQALALAAKLSQKDSSLVGNLSFATETVSGSAWLHEPAGGQNLQVGGAAYDPRAPIFQGPRPGFALKTLLDGVVAGSATQWSRGPITGGALEGQPVRWTVNRATGLVTGRSKNHRLQGVALQNIATIAGVYEGGHQFTMYAPDAPAGSATDAKVVSNGSGVLQWPANSSGAAGATGINITLVGVGPFQANGALVKTGNGTLNLTGPNTYTGATVLAGGTLNIVSNPLFTNPDQILFPGGTLRLTANPNFYDPTFSGAILTSIDSSSLNLSTTFAQRDPAAAITWSQTISDGIVRTDSEGLSRATLVTGGTLSLSGTNTISGASAFRVASNAGTIGLAGDRRGLVLRGSSIVLPVTYGDSPTPTLVSATQLDGSTYQLGAVTITFPDPTALLNDGVQWRYTLPDGGILVLTDHRIIVKVNGDVLSPDTVESAESVPDTDIPNF